MMRDAEALILPLQHVPAGAPVRGGDARNIKTLKHIGTSE